MNKPPELVELPLVILRRVTLQDDVALFDAAHDEHVMRFMDWPTPSSAAETATYLEKVDQSWNDGAEFQWVIICRSTQAVVGTISVRPKQHVADFGYFLGYQHWDKGFACEAASWVVAWLKNQPGIFRIWATADAENARSRKLLEKSGLQLEGILRKATVRPNIGGPPRDTALYAWARSDA